MAGEHVDLSSGGFPEGRDALQRRFLGVRFACCAVYARVYVNREGTAYTGNCPRCSRAVRFPIGEGGTDCRFFTVY